MARWIAVLWLMLNLVADPARAQAFPPNELGVTMGRWSLNSKDVEANKRMLVAMGGTAKKNGDREYVKFPGVLVFLNQGPSTPPPVGGSVGTVVNHVGFIVRSVQESLAKWKAAGIYVEPSTSGRLDQAYVDTPDGLRIEIFEDKNQPWPIRNEHIHFYATESEIPKMQAWYAKEFGGYAWTRNNAPVVELPGVQLRFTKSDKPQLPTAGHILDRIGFDVKDLETFTRKLAADGAKILQPYMKSLRDGGAIVIISDPWGTSIALSERPTPL